MKPRAFFWGTFFVSLGASLLLFRQDIIHIHWSVVNDYWAVLLILWGVLLLIGQGFLRVVFNICIAAILGFFVASTFSENGCHSWPSHTWHVQWHDDDSSDESSDDETADADRHIADSLSALHNKQDTAHHEVKSAPEPDTAHSARPVY